jgi:integrase
MATLTRDSKGNYRARKRLPDDVREEYGRLYGARHEAKFFAPASTKPHEAKRLFGEWLSEVEGRITNIRAQRKGEGVTLTLQQARALAGEWYTWFLARHASSDMDPQWARDQVQEAMRKAAGEKRWEANHPDELWEEEEKLRSALRPILADVGETAQFLATKSLVLNNEARVLFLDFLYKDLAAALKRLVANAEGDYSTDKYSEKFPKPLGTDSGKTPWQLFEQWAAERKPAPSTVESWRTVFRAMEIHFHGRSAAAITTEEAQHWIDISVTKERTAGTIRRTWISAGRTIFAWAKKRKLIPVNPFKEVTVTVPKAIKRREKYFRDNEWKTILTASAAIVDVSKPSGAARRWIPWLCAYTGARVGEIAQLRKVDVICRDGIDALELTPEAGTLKTKEARTVPLHEHLLAQGFLKFVGDQTDGPLFHKPERPRASENFLTVKKRLAAQLSSRLAKWVRELGVDDLAVRPNHAWRHLFIRRAYRCGIEKNIRTAMAGHSFEEVSEEYETPSLQDIVEAMKKFPRYGLD